MIRILIAEDEQRIASFICKGLSAAGFTTTVVATARLPTNTPVAASST